LLPFNSYSTPAHLSVREFSSAQAEVSEKYLKSFHFLAMHILYSVHIFVKHVQRDSEKETRGGIHKEKKSIG
jgi:hypothetical protein